MAKAFEKPQTDFIRRLIAALVLLYFFACLLPCLDGGPDHQSGDPGFPDFEKDWQFGLMILLFGWGGRNNGVPWSANVFFALGLACLWKRWLRTAVWLGLLASLLGLTTWWVRRYDTPMIGYYVWQSCLLLLAGGAVFAVRKSRVIPLDP